MEYSYIVFISGSEASEVLDLLDMEGEQAVLECLKEWDMGENDDRHDTPGYGQSDRIYRDSDYIMSYNLSLGYIALCREIPKTA
jgi:hypothetical protein